MSEADANRDLLAAAERPDPLEITQTMTFSERRARAREAEKTQRSPDFRDGRREYRLTPQEIAQQDGFPDDR